MRAWCSSCSSTNPRVPHRLRSTHMYDENHLLLSTSQQWNISSHTHLFISFQISPRLAVLIRPAFRLQRITLKLYVNVKSCNTSSDDDSTGKRYICVLIINDKLRVRRIRLIRKGLSVSRQLQPVCRSFWFCERFLLIYFRPFKRPKSLCFVFTWPEFHATI